MAKGYIHHRPDLADLAALIAHQIATDEFVAGELVLLADEALCVCVDPDDATTPFGTITVT